MTKTEFPAVFFILVNLVQDKDKDREKDKYKDRCFFILTKLFQGNCAQRRPAALHCSSRLFSAFFINPIDLLILKINVSKEVMSLIYIYENSTYESLNGNHPDIF